MFIIVGKNLFLMPFKALHFNRKCDLSSLSSKQKSHICRSDAE